MPRGIFLKVKSSAFDVVSACAGFLNGLAVARSFIESEVYKIIVVVGCEELSSVTIYKDRNTCILFGDGAGATIGKDPHSSNDSHYNKCKSAPRSNKKTRVSTVTKS